MSYVAILLEHKKLTLSYYVTFLSDIFTQVRSLQAPTVYQFRRRKALCWFVLRFACNVRLYAIFHYEFLLREKMFSF